MKKIISLGSILVLALGVFASSAPSVSAAACTFTSKATGNWSSSATWTASGSGCSTYPGQTYAGDTVNITAGNTVTVDVSPANSIATLTVGNNSSSSAAVVSFNSGITLNISGAVTIPRASSIGSSVNTVAVGAGILNAGSVEFADAGGTERHELTISTGTVTVTGNIDGTGGTGSPTITFTGAGLLQVGGSIFTNAQGTLTPGTGTVQYNGAGAQSVGDFAYNNLVLSGSAAKSIITGTSVSGNFSIAPTGSATASVGTGLNITAGSLTLGGLGRINGTWGSTSSSATNKNNTYFAATNGIITVSTDTRSTPSITTWPTASAINLGQALSASTLSGGSASAAGSFAFTSPSTVPGNAGTYSASVTFTPTDATSYKTVTGNVNVAVNVISSIVVTPTSLPIGTVNSAYSQTLTASTTAGGPFTWSIASGTLPSGLTLGTSTSTTNSISGTPTISGSANFSLKVTNGTSSTTQAYTLTINPAAVPSITITPAALPNGAAGSAYSQTLTASTTAGGPFTWSIASGTLPSGLTLGTSTSTTNSISGTPTLSGTYNFSLTVTNGTSSTTQAYVLQVGSATNLIANPTFAIANPDGSPTDWSNSAWGDASGATFAYPVAGQDDNYAAQVSISSYGTDAGGGAAEWYFNPVTVTGNGFYDFSDWYNSNTNSYLIAEFTLSDSPNPAFSQLATLAPTNGQWVNTTQDISVPADAVSVTILHLLQNNGTLTVDNYSLTAASPPSTNAFPQGMVSLTFDDGYTDQYDNVLPILNAAGQHGTFYIITNPVIAATNSQNLLVSSGVSTSTITSNSSATWGNIVNGSGDAIYVDPTDQAYTFSDTYQASAASTVTVNYCTVATGGDCPPADTSSMVIGTLPASNSVTTASFDFTLPAVSGSTVSPISISQTLNGAGSLTASSPSVIASQSYMTESQLLAIQSAGNEIASHTEDHCDLVQLSLDPNSALTDVGCPDYQLSAPSTAQTQIDGSRTALLSMGLSPVDTLAYPFGSYNSGIEQLASDDGYTAARSVDVGYNTEASDPFDLKVQNVDASTTVAQIENWIDTAKTNKLWLILVFHQVESQSLINQNADVYGVTPQTLQQVVSYLASSNVDVATVKDGAVLMNSNSNPKPQAPVATPPAGTYGTGQNVSLSALNATSINYTTDGSSPTCSTGLVYSSPIAIAATTNLQAIGCNDGVGSTISSFTYTIDNQPPTLTSVNFVSSNASSTLAKVGDTVTLTFSASYDLSTSTAVTIAGQPAAVSGSGTGPYSASYTMASSDTEGLVPFTIGFSDVFGNVGAQVSSTTDGSSVTFDKTPPTADVSYDVTAPTNGNVVATLINPSEPITVTNNGGSTSYTFTENGSFTFEFTDASGNAATATATVSNIDKTPPAIVITSPAAGISVNGTQTISFTDSKLTAPQCSVDNATWTVCVLGVTQLSGISGFSGLADGPFTLYVMDTDPLGNTATVNESLIKDTTPPVIAAHADITAEATSPAGAVVDYTAPTATDAVDGSDAVTCGPVSGSTFAFGNTTVTCNASDAAGNAATPTTFTVTVEDATPPVIAAHDNVIAEATSASGAAVSYDLPAVTDNYSTGLTAVCDPVSGSTFALGNTTVTCNATDSSGNVATSTTFTVTVEDTTPPVITVSGNNPQTIEVHTGYTELGASALDAVDGPVPVTIDASAVNTDLLGSYTVTYSATDSSGNATSTTRTVNVVDTTPPVITLLGDPAVTVQVFGSYTDAGATALDNYDGDLTSQIVTVNPVNTNVVGSYTVTYNISDSSGNAAAQVTRAVNVVDTTPPVIAPQGDLAPVEATSPDGAVVTYGAPIVTDNYDATSTATCAPVSGSTFPLGNTTVTCNATDSSGNVATSTTFTATVQDTTPPVVTVTTPASPTNAHPSISFTATDATNLTITCQVDGGAFAPCSSPFVPDITTDGPHTVTVQATDEGNNTTQATTDAFTVDATPPVITVTTQPAAYINVDSATIDFSVSGASNVSCAFDAVTYDCSTTPVALSGLSQGAHNFTITATDEVGNQSQSPIDFTVDTISPVVNLGAVASPIGTSTPSISFTVDDASPTTVQCQVDGGGFAACSSPFVTPTLNDGPHTVDVQATDAAGNQSAIVTASFTVDTQAPNVDITQAPASFINSQDASFSFTVDDASSTVECQLDSSGFSPCTSPQAYSGIAEGAHTFTVQATDELGHIGSAAANFTVDLTPPVITAPDNITAEATSADGATVIYTVPTVTDNLDPSVTAVCAPASGSTFALGDTTVTCNASDAAGNAATPVSFTVTVKDTTPPQISAPADITAAATSSAGAVVNYDLPTATDAVDGTDVVTCAPASGTTFAIGTTPVTCNSSDAAGNAATPVSFNVNVTDASAPVITLNGEAVIDLPVGAAFVDPGATATDLVDGDLTSDIVVGGDTVNTAVAGTYNINYDVVDSQGLHAVTVSRAVNVYDLTFSNEQAANVAQNSVTITWTTNNPASSLVLYDTASHDPLDPGAVAPGYGYANSTNEDFGLVTDHSVTISGLNSGTAYYFRPASSDGIEALGNELSATTSSPAAVVSGGGSGGGGYTAPAVSGVSLAINGNATTTSGANVTLTLSAVNAAQMMVSNTADFAGSTWQTFATSLPWTLSSGNGLKTVYAEFRDSSDAVSAVVSSSITLAQPQVLGASTTLLHPDGTLVLNGQTIYLIQGGQLYGFRNPQEYQSYGYTFSQAVTATTADMALPSGGILKAMPGTLALDASDNKTVYMIGDAYTKRGFATAAVFSSLGYSFANLPKIDLSDYPAGDPITSAADAHPDGALVLDGQTVWWINSGQRQGFESAAVFNTYGFSFARVVPANSADLALPQGSLVKFRDGTLVSDNGTNYIISDGQALAFGSQDIFTGLGYGQSNVIAADISSYQQGQPIQ